MKTRLLIACLFSCMLAAAHEITQVNCPSGGRVKFHCSDFSNGGRKFVKVHLSNSVWANGSSDTIFKISPSFVFDTYAPVAAFDTVTWSNCEVGGGNIGEIHSKVVNPCKSLPLSFSSIKAERINETEAKVTVVVEQVINVSHINILVSFEGKEYFTRAVIFPDNTLDRKTYSAIIKITK